MWLIIVVVVVLLVVIWILVDVLICLRNKTGIIYMIKKSCCHKYDTLEEEGGEKDGKRDSVSYGTLKAAENE